MNKVYVVLDAFGVLISLHKTEWGAMETKNKYNNIYKGSNKAHVEEWTINP